MKFAATVVLVAASLLLASPGQCQTLYRCKDAKGVSSYQQSPCAAAEQEAGEVAYRAEPDSPHWTPEIQAARDYAERQAQARAAAAQSTYYAPQPQRRRPSINPMSSDAEVMRRMEHMAGSPEGRAMLRSLNGQAAPSGSPAPTTAPSAPTQLQDQRGNTYTQPPGSSFARDDTTGKQCFVNGAFIRC